MQHRPAVPVDGARALTVERNNVATPAGRIVKIQVRERFPATTKTDDLNIVFATAVGNRLDDCVEAWDIAPTGENANAFLRHHRPLTSNAQIVAPITYFLSTAELKYSVRGGA
jgi:hypothetical protein